MALTTLKLTKDGDRLGCRLPAVKTMMSMKRPSLVLILLMIVCRTALGAQPARVIFDTDIGNDIDDGLAMAMLHSFESRGEIRLLAVTITKDNR